MHYLLLDVHEKTHTHSHQTIAFAPIHLLFNLMQKQRQRRKNRRDTLIGPLSPHYFTLWLRHTHTHLPPCHHRGALKLPVQLQALFNQHRDTKVHTGTAWVLVIVTKAVIIIPLLRRYIRFLSAGGYTINPPSSHTYIFTITDMNPHNMDIKADKESNSSPPACITQMLNSK